jgi:hypothetical protein
MHESLDVHLGGLEEHLLGRQLGRDRVGERADALDLHLDDVAGPQGTGENLAPGALGAMVVGFVEAAYRSALENAPVAIPPPGAAA